MNDTGTCRVHSLSGQAGGRKQLGGGYRQGGGEHRTRQGQTGRLTGVPMPYTLEDLHSRDRLQLCSGMENRRRPIIRAGVVEYQTEKAYRSPMRLGDGQGRGIEGAQVRCAHQQGRQGPDCHDLGDPDLGIAQGRQQAACPLDHQIVCAATALQGALKLFDRQGDPLQACRQGRRRGDGELAGADQLRRLAIALQGGQRASVIARGPIPATTGYRLMDPDRTPQGTQTGDQEPGDPGFPHSCPGSDDYDLTRMCAPRDAQGVNLRKLGA